jgi:parallel beta-helix repeat protein
MLGRIVVAVGSAVLIGLLADGAEAQVACGDVIQPGTTVVLQGNLGPCSKQLGGPALVVDSAVLDLNGFTVSCEPGLPLGVVLAGRRAQLVNGTVSGCRYGVVLRGLGRHRVQGVRAELSEYAGFTVQSHRNRIRDSVAADNGTKGFGVSGDSNRIENSEAHGNFRGMLIKGRRNRLKANTVLDNEGVGVYVRGDRNRLHDNVTDGNGAHGVVLAGKSNVAAGNRAQGNGGAGMRITGAKNGSEGNTVQDNQGTGVDVLGLGNRVARNEASGNGVAGIAVATGAGDNKLDRNTASLNLGGNLVDANPGCLTNEWSDNQGGGNQGCVK